MIRKALVVLAVALMAETCLAAWPQTSETHTFYVSTTPADFQRQMTDANSELNRVLSQFNLSGSGTTVTPYRLVAPNRAEATVYSSLFGTTYTIIAINNPSGGASSSPALTASRVLRNSVLSRAAPGEGAEERRRSRPRGGFRADIFYNQWETEAPGEADGTEGSVVGINPCITFGSERVELGVTIPIHVSMPDPDSEQELGVTIPIHVSMPDPDSEQDPTFHIGVDFMFKAWLGRFVSLGAHASYVASLMTVSGATEDEADTVDAQSDVNGGPFVSVKIPLGRVGVFSAAALLENYYHVASEGDDGGSDVVTELALAGNLGFYLGSAGALNLYAVHRQNLDSEADDDGYEEVGAEVQLGSGTWALSLGAKTLVGIDNYTSIEGYLGSQWRW